MGAEPDDADLLKVEKMPSLWVKTLETRAWAGYKDNILLSNENIEGSPFLAGGLDLTFMRVPIDGWECLVLTSAEYVRYLSARDVDQEANALVEAQVKKTFDNGWRTGLTSEYLYFKQVFDNSIFSTQLVALPVDGHTLSMRPFVGKDLGHGYRLDFELPANRQIFDQFIDNYWEVAPKLTFGREYGRKSDLAVSYQFLDRLHDTRLARDASGNLLSGPGLQFWQQDLSLVWRQNWDQASHWRTTTRLSLQRNEDNGGGYYNYWRPLLSEQLRFRSKTWEIRAEARASYYQYDSQLVGDAGSPIRHKTYLRLNLRAEKTLSKSWKVFADYEHERAISNLDIDAYTVHTVSAGVAWEF